MDLEEKSKINLQITKIRHIFATTNQKFICLMETDIIYNEDCLETMFGGHIDEHSIDIVLTSPPYNTSRTSSKEDPYSFRYDSYNDGLTDEEYTDFICKCFEGYDRILKKNGSVLFNVSYSSKTLHYCGILFQIYREGLLLLFQTALYGKRRTQYRIM